MPLQHFLQPREAGVKPVVRDAERLSEACRLSIRSAARNTELGSGADSHQVHVVAHCSDTRGAEFSPSELMRLFFGHLGWYIAGRDYC